MKILRYNGNTHKLCNTCLEILPLGSFTKKRKFKNDLRAQCKKCLNVSRNKYNKSDKGKAAVERGKAAQKIVRARAGARNNAATVRAGAVQKTISPPR